MSKGTLIFIICLVNCELILCNHVVSRLVDTTSGPVRGYKSTYGDFFAFFGIPYATAPTGPKKFNAPLPAPRWTEPLEAVNDDIFCPQARIPTKWAETNHYQEDCLVVNVFVPNVTNSLQTNLSVVIYIHGGAYQVGGGNLLRPYELMNEAEDIIFVNFNHRLGVHGYLCLGTDDIPGNAGMKDQVAALRWVKNNIASFGGNNEDITLAGYSAGASAADLLMLSEMAKGLFTKIILDSGTACAVWSVQLDPLELAKEFAGTLNFTTDIVSDLEQFYKNLTYDELTSDTFSDRYDHTFAFVPCIERDLGQEMFLREAPVDIIKKGNAEKLPTLIGFAELEGLMRMEEFEEWKDIMNDDFTKFLPADLQFHSAKQKENVAHQLKNFYFADKDVSNDTLEEYFEFLGDASFAYPILHNVRMHLEAGNEQVYLYQYSYINDNITSSYIYPHIKKANHCAQSYEILGSHENTDEQYRHMVTILRKLWTNFIKTGKPVPEATAEFTQGWPSCTKPEGPYLELNLPVQLKSDLLSKKVRFWDKIYDHHYKKPASP